MGFDIRINPTDQEENGQTRTVCNIFLGGSRTLDIKQWVTEVDNDILDRIPDEPKNNRGGVNLTDLEDEELVKDIIKEIRE